MLQKTYINKSNIKEKSGIKITLKAEKQILKLIKKNIDCIGIKINIKKSGCAGFKYTLNLIYISKDSDIMFYYNKIPLYIPKKKWSILKNTIIDYFKSGLNYNFTFYNSNNIYHCGCGESFNIK
ncbi:Fe-S assembly scaffold protein [Buchnera aphidicola (Cinara tujafilina)]|uniref:Fe-S assembly scaffold protein n=1 Tax=Buchnera aphidicola (Cinara tujafilina) TaxID=261317 RepID=F7WZ19_9GAMM|nr:iron-sulfur cluster assembly accessory protein [Buchnera aphidicola]AEH39669.1 Fe-S assembly scaffold protein [Buchnera aphidicola (Cinara tujafilina)]